MQENQARSLPFAAVVHPAGPSVPLPQLMGSLSRHPAPGASLLPILGSAPTVLSSTTRASPHSESIQIHKSHFVQSPRTKSCLTLMFSLILMTYKSGKSGGVSGKAEQIMWPRALPPVAGWLRCSQDSQ